MTKYSLTNIFPNNPNEHVDNDSDGICNEDDPCPDIPIGTDVDEDGVDDCIDECIGYGDECGICEGNGIPEGECDCYGNIVDCFGECGGDSVVDECGVCNGPGAIFECGCSKFYKGGRQTLFYIRNSIQGIEHNYSKI